MIQLWTYLMPCSRVSIVNFEQVNAGWDSIADTVLNLFLDSKEYLEELV